MIILLKGFIKQSVIEQTTTFLNFSFSLTFVRLFFVFPYQSVCKFLTIEKISSISSHCILKWRKSENTDSNILPKTLVSNVILTFLDHLKPKIFFVSQPWWLT